MIAAIILCLVGIAWLAARNGTPAGNGPSCGPIDVFGYTFTIDLSCDLASKIELGAAIVCFALAAIALMTRRSRGDLSRW
jgi:hypothetical protein